MIRAALWLACLFFPLEVVAAQWIKTDVCVYGGTSGGVIAAVQAARLGKTVALVSVNNHLGGMTASGLGQTDIGFFGDSYIQGLAREFYTRIGRKYGTGTKFTFEPHVAEAVFDDMAKEAGVQIYTNQHLVSVGMQNQCLTAITMNNSNVFQAKMYIDASYEGDLMAKAGVSYTVGREASSEYSESLNGIRPPNDDGHQFGSVLVNPYVVTNDPGSGLLPLVQSGSPGTPGAADTNVQSYNFRLCLTQVATNQIPITAPANYDPADYELLARYIQALVAQGYAPSLGDFMNIYSMPDGKTDINNNGPVSTDYIGYSTPYVQADYATRQEIWQAHKNYLQGFLYFLAHDPRVPSNLRSQMQSYGLCKDEFADDGGWPHQLYVREARRMVSDYVITESNCLGEATAPDPIGLAAYSMDSHNVRRIVSGGYVENEGDTYPQGGIPHPFPISYRAIIPKVGQCKNLLVPWCLSASHIAFGSIRLEPTFMIIAQSAAVAACLAIDDHVPVQQLDYAKLRLQLLADQQDLSWGSNSGDTGVIVDNADSTGVAVIGAWTSSTSSPGYYGTNYLHDGNTGKGTKSVRFTPALPTADNYRVYLRWTSDPNRANNVPVDVVSANGMNHFSFNQQQNGGQWVYVGTFPFDAGTNGNVLIRTTGTSGYVVADAVRFVSAEMLEAVNLITTCGEAQEWQKRPGWFTVIRDGDTNTALTVNYTIGGTATNGVDYLPLSGSVVIPAGACAATITVTPIADNVVKGSRTVIARLSASSNYNLGTFTNAMLTIEDTPLAQWKMAHFTSSQLAEPDISGDGADPNEDGLPNLAEYALGLDPLGTHVTGMPKVSIQSNLLTLTFQRAEAALDVVLNVQTSTNLVDWTSGANYVDESIVADNGTVETHLAQAKLPVQDNHCCFLRLQFSRQ